MTASDQKHIAEAMIELRDMRDEWILRRLREKRRARLANDAARRARVKR